MHILSLVTDNEPFLNQRKEENDCRNYFMINLDESMGPGQDRSPVTPGSAVGLATDCTTRPCDDSYKKFLFFKHLNL